MKDLQSLKDGESEGQQSAEAAEESAEPAVPEELVEADEPEQLVEVPAEPAQAAEPEAQRRCGGLPRASTPQWAQALVNETLEDLGAHTNCMSVAWSAARNSFKVVRKSDKAKKEFCVKGLKRKREESEMSNGEDIVQVLFERSKAYATSFLTQAPAAPDAIPLDDE